jgi:choline dehydrogenase
VTFDFVVVGAGTAGCVLASRLTEDGRSRVLLLEAGPRDRSPWIHLPIGYGKTMFDARYNWRFETEPDAGMEGRKLYWPRGRGLGGSSSINGLIYIRGQPEDYDEWAAQGNAGWAWCDLLPLFRRMEHNTRGASEWHGAEGPQWCSDIGRPHELMEAIIRGAEELGVARNDDFNGARQEGVGYYQLFTRRGLRCSTAVGYLRRAAKRANLEVRTDAHATRVLFEGRRAVGVEYRRGTRLEAVRAAREVILCAGAVQTPQLLQLSGVGPAALLGEHGIPVVADLPGVGENLQDHLQLRLIYRVSGPITTNDDLRSLAGRARIGLEWLLWRRGPLAVGINQGGLFTRLMPDAGRPDIQFHFGTLSADVAGGAPHPWPGCTFSVCQLRPRSRGTIRIASRDPLAAPAIRPNYLSEQVDRLYAVESLRYARRLAATRALAPYLVEEHRPGPAVQDDAALLDFARRFGQTIFHPVGTCRMGSDAMAVVDPQLRVRGVSGLRVADASIMPSIVSGNTNAPVIVIAEKAAEIMGTVPIFRAGPRRSACTGRARGGRP